MHPRFSQVDGYMDLAGVQRIAGERPRRTCSSALNALMRGVYLYSIRERWDRVPPSETDRSLPRQGLMLCAMFYSGTRNPLYLRKIQISLYL